MKKKPTLHERALRFFNEVRRTPKEAKAQEVVSHYVLRKREEIVNHVTPLLSEMQAAFEHGEVIGGAKSMKEYCKMYKHEGCLTYARVRQILTGTTGHGKVKRLDLLVGKTVRVGELDFIFTQEMVNFACDLVEREATEKTIAASSKRPSARFTRHAGKPGDYRTACGVLAKKYGGKRRAGVVFAEGDEKVDCPACLKQATPEEHTGQHEECVECFHFYEAETIRNARYDHIREVWRKRMQTLINTWRSGRLRDANKYREEFDKASAKYLKSAAKVSENVEPWIKEARDRMEAAIADRLRFEKRLEKDTEPLSEPAKALAAAVDGADVPHGIASEAVEMVKRMKARAALGLPQGDTCPTGDEDES